MRPEPSRVGSSSATAQVQPSKGSNRWARVAVVPVVLVALAAVLGLVHARAEEMLDGWATEDGLIETAQVLLFLAAALTCAWGLRRGTAVRWAWPILFGSVLLALEEIDWGQRILGYSTPDALEVNNRQQSFNVHNLAGVHENIRALGICLLLVAFVGLPLLARTSTRGRGLLERLRLPVPHATCVTAAVLAVLFMLVPRLGGEVVFALDEVGELFLALTICAYALLVAQGRAPRRP